MESVGERIVRLRESKGIKQTVLADILLIARPYLSNIERGISPLSQKIAGKLAKEFGVSKEYLLTGENPPSTDRVPSLRVEKEWLKQIALALGKSDDDSSYHSILDAYGNHILWTLNDAHRVIYTVPMQKMKLECENGTPIEEVIKNHEKQIEIIKEYARYVGHTMTVLSTLNRLNTFTVLANKMNSL